MKVHGSVRLWKNTSQSEFQSSSAQVHDHWGIELNAAFNPLLFQIPSTPTEDTTAITAPPARARQ